MVSETTKNTRFTMSNGFQASFARDERSGTEKEVSFKEEAVSTKNISKPISGNKNSLKNAKIVQNMKVGMHNRKQNE